MNNLVKGLVLTPFNIFYKISPKKEIETLFRLRQGYKLNLENPRTYNEKIQWIKLNDFNPLIPKCCDKYAVRQIVSDLGCSEILNDLYWNGFNPEDIPFDMLPNKFVIKATHGSSFNIICENKAKIDKDMVISKCKKWLKAKYLPCYGEWFYGVEKPRIIVEKFIESDDCKQLRDYKVYCFNGEPYYIRIISDRFTNLCDDVYLPDWTHLDGVHMGYGCSSYKYEKPNCLELLLEYSRRLSKPFINARTDFYIVNNKIIFGEITFTSGAGFDRFSSYGFDLEMGSKLKLPKK